MKQKFILIASLCFLVSFFSANAQIFWKISGNGLAKPSYLLGTHHLIEREQIPGFDKIASCIDQTDMVVGEMDMSKMLSMQVKLIQSGIMKDSSMNQLLNAEDYQLVDARFKELMGKGLDQLGRMKPAMLSAMYTVMFYMKETNTKKEPEAVDIEVQKIGKKAGKKILGLETIDQQIDFLLNSSSLKHQAEMLVEAVRDKDKAIDLLKQLNEAYQAGDLSKMVSLSKEDGSANENDLKILIDDRNKNWLNQLVKIIPEKSCFIAVGCLHLADEKGLIQLFRNAGYSVEAVVL